MRILHVHSGNLYGGVETFLVTLAREASSAPDMTSVYAVCFDGRLSRELAAIECAPHSLGHVRLSRPDTIWRARRSLVWLLRQDTFDAVVCHQAWPYAIFGPAIRHAGIPLVLWAHTVNDGWHWLDRWAQTLTPDLVVCNSRYTAARLATSYRTTRVEWVYYPLTLAPGADVWPRGDLRRAQQTSPADVIIVQVGRLESLKGHRQALKALARLRDLDGWIYWIVGGPQRSSDERYRKSLVALADRLGISDRVRFVGERTDVPELLRVADIYCQPNIRPEAFGISLVEALNAGLPVVTSGIGGACEIVDESCGMLTPPHDVPALAAALRQLIANPETRRTLGRHARTRPAVLCDAPRQMRRVEELLSSVCPGETLNQQPSAAFI